MFFSPYFFHIVSNVFFLVCNMMSFAADSQAELISAAAGPGPLEGGAERFIMFFDDGGKMGGVSL